MAGKFVLLTTMQSSGTWWTIDALRRHPQIGGLANPANLMSLQNGWVLRGNHSGNPNKESLASDGKITLIYEHWRAPYYTTYRHWWHMTESELMTLLCPTLSPLRDPLICMIRAWDREPPLYPHDYLIDDWIHMARRSGILPIHFWKMEPFDMAGFLNALASVGLSAPDPWKASLTPAVRINSNGDSALKKAYRAGDTRTIEKTIPSIWRRLRESEPLMRPFLERHGYSSLLWWS